MSMTACVQVRMRMIVGAWVRTCACVCMCARAVVGHAWGGVSTGATVIRKNVDRLHLVVQ